MTVVKKTPDSVLLKDETGFTFYVPASVFDQKDDEGVNLLDHMIPYSLSFDIIVQDMVNVEKIQTELYKLGIHTYEDILNNRKVVNDVLKRHFSAEQIIKAIKNSKGD